MEITNQAMPLIKARLKTTASRQKSYADLHKKEVVFQVGDMMLLKVSLIKGIIRFRKKGKLAPRHIRPYEVLQKVKNVPITFCLTHTCT